VLVKHGPLAGIRGEVIYHKGKHRLVIRVKALNDRAVAIEVDEAIVARPVAASIPGGRIITAPAQFYKVAAL
jgi:hypothetical protein